MLVGDRFEAVRKSANKFVFYIQFFLVELGLIILSGGVFASNPAMSRRLTENPQ